MYINKKYYLSIYIDIIFLNPKHILTKLFEFSIKIIYTEFGSYVIKNKVSGFVERFKVCAYIKTIMMVNLLVPICF